MCIGSWSFFVIYQALIGYDKYASFQPLCSFSDKDYPIWYWHICSGVFGAWIIIGFAVLIKISQISEMDDKVPHIVAFNIVSMGALASGMALTLDWGGICMDTLG